MAEGKWHHPQMDCSLWTSLSSCYSACHWAGWLQQSTCAVAHPKQEEALFFLLGHYPQVTVEQADYLGKRCKRERSSLMEELEREKKESDSKKHVWRDGVHSTESVSAGSKCGAPLTCVSPYQPDLRHFKTKSLSNKSCLLLLWTVMVAMFLTLCWRLQCQQWYHRYHWKRES